MNEIYDGKQQLPESPTYQAIATGQSKISHVGEGGLAQYREVDGINWFGQSHQYEVVISDPNQPDGERVHYLTVWSPTETKEWRLRPDTQIYISAKEGEMIFTKDKEKQMAVLDEINRQMNPPKEKK